MIKLQLCIIYRHRAEVEVNQIPLQSDQAIFSNYKSYLMTRLEEMSEHQKEFLQMTRLYYHETSDNEREIMLKGALLHFTYNYS